MDIDRRSFGRGLAAGVGVGMGLSGTAALAQTQAEGRGDEGGMRYGKLFTITNSAAGNELLVIGDDPRGALALLVRYQTSGLGSGAGLGSQGAVTLSDDGRYLFAVNAGSNTVSTFALRFGALTLESVHDSGGLHPISVTESDGVVYVLNDGGAGNVAGFRNERGRLSALAGSVRPLSAAGGTGPAQVSIGTEGDVLIVTEKTTNRIVSYALSRNGRAGPPRVTASAGVTPFGFAFDRRNRLLVSEAGANTLSTYRFDDASPTAPIVVSPAVPNGQAASCWAAVTPNGRFVYVGNAGTSSVSQYAIDRHGAASLIAGAAGSTGAGAANDLAIANHGRSLGVLAPRAPGVFRFTIAADGSLGPAGSAIGLPAGIVGLAAN
jgi:6-phosphogluconolactonase